jgi:hypothetical protein
MLSFEPAESCAVLGPPRLPPFFNTGGWMLSFEPAESCAVLVPPRLLLFLFVDLNGLLSTDVSLSVTLSAV